MQRKGYVPGAAALLAVLLTACSGGTGTDNPAGDAKPGEVSATQTAEPGRYRTLPDACRAVDHGTLDRMLPGLRQLDQEQRAKAYEGSAAVTYDTDRRVGCSWKVESPDSTHHLGVDFERVVSYDGAVSDDARAGEVYGQKEKAADLPEPSPDESDGESGSPSTEASDSPDASGDSSGNAVDDAKNPGKTPEKNENNENNEKNSDKESGGDSGQESGKASGGSGKNGDASGDGSASAEDGSSGEADSGDGASESDGEGEAVVPDALLPRILSDLGDEAFLDDRLASAGSTVQHRTVTVVFRTSNVVVTVQYEEQPARGSELPDSKELQDKARELAGRLAEQFAD
ncbi:DUF3558 domain-containing protein [Streptomyces sp. LHD-70]|uniref:DUF3558 domain-containing protein n=1 Tax=Streptomyces sp. LHD-70 TaxID=3072140 RepID=UPI0028102DA9|nr:DUF3558 domain-containing protein [Streptomyces sp. LHD-70]MDQ8708175.1 DUF3558 domain-containing protein [Streptomyces sp. LHD-70]